MPIVKTVSHRCLTVIIYYVRPVKILTYFLFCFFRQSWTQCTSTSLGFIWSVPVIFFSFPTPPSGPMCSKRLSLSELQLTKTRKSHNSRLIIIRLLKASGIPELEDLRKSKKYYFFLPEGCFFCGPPIVGSQLFSSPSMICISDISQQCLYYNYGLLTNGSLKFFFLVHLGNEPIAFA